MVVAEELQIIIDAKTAGAKRELKQVSGQMDKTTKSAGGLEKVLKRGLGAVAAAVSVGALTKVLKDSVEAFKAQEQAERSLTAAVERNPLLNEGAATRIEEFAAELQKVSVVGDETAIQLAAIAASSGRSEQEITKMVQAAADVSAALGITMDSAIKSLNKSFGGMTGELGELIPELQDLSKEQLKAGEGVDLVAEQFRGAAEAIGDTATGSVQQMSNAFGDLQEQMGRSFLDNAQPVITFFTDLAAKIGTAMGKINDIEAAMDRLQTGEMSDSLEQERQSLVDMIEEMERLEKFSGRLSGADQARKEELKALIPEQRAHVKNLEMTAYFQGQVADASDETKAAVEELTQGEKDFIAVNTTLQQQLRQIDELEAALGDRYDEKVAKANAVKAAIQELVERGYKTEKPNIKTIIEFYGHLLDIQGDVKESYDRVKDSLVEVNTQYAAFAQGTIEGTKTAVEQTKTFEEKIKDIQDAVQKVNIAFSAGMGVFNEWMVLESNRNQMVLNNLEVELEKMRERHEGEIEFAKQRGATEEEIAEIKREQKKEEEAAEKRIAKKKYQLEKQEFQRKKQANLAQIAMDTAAAVVKALPNFVLAGIVGASGAAQAAIVAQQKYPGFAKGGEFVTDGPQSIVVGDNPGGRERVRIDPMPDNRSSSGNVTINISGAIGDREEVAIWVEEGLQRARKRGAA